MGKKIAIVLSGCGHRDGTELTEGVSAWLALDEVGAEVSFFAPDRPFAVKDHLGGQPADESRSMLAEAARLARGKISALAELRTSSFDGVVLPGGFGAATNLSAWGTRGAAGEVDPEVARVLTEFHAAGKPIAAICIAPALVAKVLGREGVTVTLGDGAEVAAEVAKTGAHHETCAVDDFVTDREHRIVTTPAYMYGDARPFAVYTGIRKAMRELNEMA